MKHHHRLHFLGASFPGSLHHCRIVYYVASGDVSAECKESLSRPIMAPLVRPVASADHQQDPSPHGGMAQAAKVKKPTQRRPGRVFSTHCPSNFVFPPPPAVISQQPWDLSRGQAMAGRPAESVAPVGLHISCSRRTQSPAPARTPPARPTHQLRLSLLPGFEPPGMRGAQAETPHPRERPRQTGGRLRATREHTNHLLRLGRVALGSRGGHVRPMRERPARSNDTTHACHSQFFPRPANVDQTDHGGRQGCLRRHGRVCIRPASRSRPWLLIPGCSSD
jgi:hypothetical protein